MPIAFDQPALLWLLLLGIPIIALGMRSLAVLDPARRWTAIGLRLLTLGLMVFMLAGLQSVQRHTDLTVIAVVDQSESIRRFASPPPSEAEAVDAKASRSIEQWVQDYLRQAGQDRRADDRLGMVRYDARPTVTLPDRTVELDPGTLGSPLDGTDSAAALRASMAIAQADSAVRLVLVSDGNDTDGNLIAAAREAAAADIPIDVLPIHYQVQQEVLVQALYAPTDAREGQTVALRVVLRATQPTTGILHLLHDDQAVPLGAEAGGGTPITLKDWTSQEATDDADIHVGRYVAVKQIDLSLGYSGANKFEAVFEPTLGTDTMAINNAAQAFTLVSGKGRILIVDGVGGPSGSILPQALASHGIVYDIVEPHAFPSRMGQLQRYDAVLFQNVSAEMITTPQQKMLVKYVHDLGGGFAMIGGPDSFGAGGWTNTPIDRFLLPVTCQIPSQTILPSGALVLVIDRSGSMSSSVGGSNKSQQEIAGEAAILALQSLYPQDLVGVVAFDNSAKLVVDVQLNTDPTGVAKRIRQIKPAGGTNIYSGLELAYRRLAPLRTQDAAIKHMILLTDGQSTNGNYIKLVGQMAAHDITLSTIGVGDGHDAQLLAKLAQMGGGNYHPIKNPNNLPQIFIKEAKTIRKNLIKEKPFQPSLVATGSPIMANVSAVPQLQGLVLTGPRSDPRIFVPLVGAEGEPVFAHWQVGLGRAAAFTSDATNRWASPWLNWEGYPDFWARLVRYLARPTQSRDVDLVTAIRDGKLHIRLDAPDQDGQTRKPPAAGSFGNFLDIQGSVIAPDGSTIPVSLQQTGPGIYEATTDATQAGNYIVSLFVTPPGGERKAVFGGVSQPPGKELRRFTSNLPLLQEVARITGGRMLDPLNPQLAGLFERTITFESRSIRPLWRSLLILLLICFFLDVANRRVAWDIPASWAWIKQRFSAFAGTGSDRTPQQATATLSALKKTRTRKFEAAPDAVAADHFAQAVGGAQKEDPLNLPKTQTPSTDDQQSMSRLRAAKQAARQRMNQD